MEQDNVRVVIRNNEGMNRCHCPINREGNKQTNKMVAFQNAFVAPSFKEVSEILQRAAEITINKRRRC